MAVNTTPIFVKTPRSENAQIPNGSGTTPVDLITGVVDGTRVDSVTIVALGGLTTASRYKIQMIVSGGTARVLVDRPITDPGTVSDTLAPFSETVQLGAFLKDATSKLQVVLTQASPGVAVDFTAHAGDYA